MSMRRYAILVFAAGALCAQACSSSGTKTGTGGATGSGGATATGGKIGTGGTTGVGGMTTGTGGTTTDSGTDVPRDVAMDVAVTDTATDTGGPNLAVLCPGAQGDAGTVPTMSVADFCAVYLQTCGGNNHPDGGPSDLATCMAAYNSAAANKQCRSTHVCNAAVYYPATATALHCTHAAGAPPCADSVDAGGN